eukprot:gb/GECG01000780.1/.p1 GENE.gb/GECG01000780.1/~~gb/GECG01000780.1/.p1  ORF type:complete len:368 (+),score=31.96 gb/GECG01000780.1/:1-1104(+)
MMLTMRSMRASSLLPRKTLTTPSASMAPLANAVSGARFKTYDMQDRERALEVRAAIWDSSYLRLEKTPFFIEQDEKDDWLQQQKTTISTLTQPHAPLEGEIGAKHLAHSIVVFASISGKLEDTLPRCDLGRTYIQLTTGIRELLNKPNDKSEIAEAVKNLVDYTFEAWDPEGHHDNEGQAVQQLVSHVAAVIMCRQWALERTPLTTELLVDLHKILLQGSHADYAGQWRTTPVHAGWHLFPHVDTAEQMEKLVQHEIIDPVDSRKTKHVIFVASHLLHNVCKIHPFVNGNGRLARLLFTFLLFREGYPFPAIFTSGRSKARKHYGLALQRADNSNFQLLYATGIHSVASSWQNYQQNALILQNSVQK